MERHPKKRKTQTETEKKTLFAILLENSPYVCLYVSLWLAHCFALYSILLSSWLCIAGGGTEEEKVEKNEVMKKTETKL